MCVCVCVDVCVVCLTKLCPAAGTWRSPGSQADSDSSVQSAGSNSALFSAEELAELARHGDMPLLHALRGVEGVAALIHQAVAMDMEGSVPGALPPPTPVAVSATTLSDGMARCLLYTHTHTHTHTHIHTHTHTHSDTEAARRRIFGTNDTTQRRRLPCVTCVFLRLLVGCLTDDVVLLFAGVYACMYV